jgi:polyphosphate kinase 2 (PPK2 family)
MFRKKNRITRLTERLHEPSKMWKYNEKDLEEANCGMCIWRCSEDCFNNCNNPPWTIVPSDQNWYKEFIIATQLRDLLINLKMQFPGLKK